MTYLVIGSGSIGRRHHANLTALGADCQVLGWRGLDLTSLDLSQVRGLVVATATPVRVAVIAKAASEGVPLYIEKPLVFREEDLTQIKDLTTDIASRSVLGLMMRYHPAIRYLKANPVDAYHLQFEIGHDVRQWRENWVFSESYAAEADGGGVLLDLCHELDMAQALYPGLALGAVDCVGHTDFPGVDFATQIAVTGPGMVGMVSMDYLAPRGVRRLALKGRDDMVELDLLANAGRRWHNSQETALHWDFERNDMFLDLMRDFMALAEGRPPSDNPLLPRLDHVWDSAELTVQAWRARVFHSAREGGFA